MKAWREKMPCSGSKRWVMLDSSRLVDLGKINSKKVLYFCGDEFNHAMFPSKEEWQVFVETIPQATE
jgi:hypothetical protein